MEDILASIRRILAEDEPVPEPGAPITAPATNGGGTPALKEDVLVLDSSMLAPAPEPAPVITPPPAAPAPRPDAAAAAPTVGTATEVVTRAPAGDDGRPLVTRNSLPCFEDVVREAVRPVIQQWVDAALPKLVERMVRTEVERVVGGAV